ncbi:twin-arginine translocase TatA/TatE family subunit [candidate division KSB1 bacterium]|nr:twin-arginine translocase TatA/TatE family subunit [candidate division KSB1 bacterium]
MGIGVQEMIWIFLILVLLFGAKKLPELAQGLGKGIREFKKAAKEIEEDGAGGEKKISSDKTETPSD